MLVGTWKWRAAEVRKAKDDLKSTVGWGYEGYGVKARMAMNREKWRCGIMGRMSDPHKRGNNGR